MNCICHTGSYWSRKTQTAGRHNTHVQTGAFQGPCSQHQGLRGKQKAAYVQNTQLSASTWHSARMWLPQSHRPSHSGMQLQLKTQCCLLLLAVTPIKPDQCNFASAGPDIVWWNSYGSHNLTHTLGRIISTSHSITLNFTAERDIVTIHIMQQSQNIYGVRNQNHCMFAWVSDAICDNSILE